MSAVREGPRKILIATFFHDFLTKIPSKQLAMFELRIRLIGFTK